MRECGGNCSPFAPTGSKLKFLICPTGGGTNHQEIFPSPLQEIDDSSHVRQNDRKFQF